MKISIITVCLNSAKTIERTMQSVIGQNYDDMEYIIIDGGSTDGTVDIIRKYERYLAYWVSETDWGIYDAMNKGVARATGEVVAFLNSDDWYEDSTLNKVAAYFRQYRPMILSGKINTLQKGKWKEFSLEFDELDDNIRIGMNCRHSATFVKKELFDFFGGFDMRYKIAADYEWLLRLYDKGIRMLKVEDVFTNFSSTGISSVNAILTIKEARHIALSALDRNSCIGAGEREEWRRKILDLYNGEQKRLEIKNIIKNGKIDCYPNLRMKMLDCFREKVYVIWGTGIIGEEVFSLLSQLGLGIRYFIDSNIKTLDERFHEIPVKLPTAVSHSETVIVASIEYEDEIVNQLENMQYEEENDYILYSKLIEQFATV